MTEVFKQLFLRDLGKLKAEIELYRDERNLWRVEGEIANSAGNLCLHLVGNLNTYIGAEFGKTGYVRNRPLEFSAKDVPKAELLKKIDATLQVLDAAFDNISEAQLAEAYPQNVFEEPVTTGYFLTHLAMHLAYHLGQVNYHRRLVDNY